MKRWVLILFYMAVGAALALGFVWLSSLRNKGNIPAGGEAAITGTTVTPRPDTSDEKLVTRVIDGDTVVLQNGDVVRLIGIDSPERDKPYFTESSAKLAELIAGKAVSLETDISDRDRYNRVLRYIWVGGTLINLEMIKQGYAVAYSYPPDVKYADDFSKAQSEARAAGRGLWANPSPQARPDLSRAGSREQGRGATTNAQCTSNTYNCSSFSTQAESQAIFDSCGGSTNDIHKLDSDSDGVACEFLP